MLSLAGLSKEYSTPAGTLPILEGLDLTLRRGEAIAVMGPSGSGKSTLLHILGVLDRPTAGSVSLDGIDPFALTEAEQARFRGEKVGFVFQDHSLLPQCSVLENVLVPALIARDRVSFDARARELLERVGLSDRLDHRPGQLSGGEKQRAAIARALVRHPALLLCDEPTGNLDHDSAERAAAVLLDLHREQQTILIVVTHSAQIAAKFPVRFELRERRLVSLP